MLVTIFKQLYHICLFILYKIIAQSLGRGVNSFFFNLGGGRERESRFSESYCLSKMFMEFYGIARVSIQKNEMGICEGAVILKYWKDYWREPHLKCSSSVKVRKSHNVPIFPSPVYSTSYLHMVYGASLQHGFPAFNCRKPRFETCFTTC